MGEVLFYRDSEYEYGWKAGAINIHAGDPIQDREDGLIWRAFDVYAIDLDTGAILDKVNYAVVELDERVEPPVVMQVLRIDSLDTGDSFSEQLLEVFRQLTDTD